jgi:SNF2 family DNA or RNA helicase
MTETPARFPYQLEGAPWLAGRVFALLADSMGLGKSVQAIDAATLANLHRVLIIGPAIARRNWARELEKWGGRFAALVLETFDQKPPAVPPRKPYACIVSYAYAVVNRQALIDAGPWDVLIIDEAHNLKNPQTKRSKAVLAAVPDGNGGVHLPIAQVCDRVWALTGTPLTRHAGEIWNLAYTAGVTQLSYSKWCRKYCQEIPGGQIVGSKDVMLQDLHEVLKASGWMLRRTKEEVKLQLPPISYHELVVEPGTISHEEMQASFEDYDERRQEIADKLAYEEEFLKMAMGEAHVLSTELISLLEGMAASVATLRRINGLRKVHPVASIVEAELEADEVDKIVIAYIHRSVGDTLERRLLRFGVSHIRGGVSPRLRDKAITDFQVPRWGLCPDGTRSPRVALVQYEAGATAINLFEAHHMVALEVPWVGSTLSQMIARLWRLGQRHPVQIRYAVLEDSMDPDVLRTLLKRAREISHILDGVPRELLEDQDGFLSRRHGLNRQQLRGMILG